MSATFIDAEFPLSGLPAPRAVRLELTQANNRHDVALLTLSRTSPSDLPTYRSGQPIRISWGANGEGRVFCGYVHHIRPVVDKVTRTLTLVCIGASMRLQSSRQDVLTDVTADAAVSQLVTPAGFDVDAEPHARVWPALALPGVSTWQFLADLAKRIGYVIYATNTQIHFHSVLRDALLYADSATALRMPSPTEPGLGTLLTFNPRLGDALPGRRLRTVQGVDPYTTSVVGHTDDGGWGVLGRDLADTLFTEHLTSATTLSEGDARYNVAAANAGLHMTARATSVGIVSLRQSAPVYVDGVDDSLRGYWVINSVTHRIERPEHAAGRHDATTAGSYVCDLELGRDSSGYSAIPPSGPLRRPLDVRVGSPAALTADGLWVATRTKTQTALADPSRQPGVPLTSGQQAYELDDAVMGAILSRRTRSK